MMTKQARKAEEILIECEALASLSEDGEIRDLVKQYNTVRKLMLDYELISCPDCVDQQLSAPCRTCDDSGVVAVADKQVDSLKSVLKNVLELTIKTEEALSSDNSQQREYAKQHSQHIRNLVKVNAGVTL